MRTPRRSSLTCIHQGGIFLRQSMSKRKPSTRPKFPKGLIMTSRGHRFLFACFLSVACWLAANTSSQLFGQRMASVVNSGADDADAYPYDNPNTPNIDESIDGVCGD